MFPSARLRPSSWAALLLSLMGCEEPPIQVAPTPPPTPPPAALPTTKAVCGGQPMTVKFYDVGQGLGVLVTLPSGRRVLVDTGVLPTWPGCKACKGWSQRFLDALAGDVPDKTLDTIWITHQHADHNGNADTVMKTYAVGRFVDNGTAGQTQGQKKRVRLLRDIATEQGVAHWIAAPGRANSPWPASPDLTLTPVVPDAWPVKCDGRHGVNNCSIGLRIDYCESSVLFTGDAESDEEEVLPVSPVDLLQVAHHGSRTSTTMGFLEKTKPEYAVISSGRKNEGTNAGYCHPVAGTVSRLNEVLAPQRSRWLWAFSGESCPKQVPEEWERTKTSDHLYATARDGDVTFVTKGDGTFRVTRSAQ